MKSQNTSSRKQYDNDLARCVERARKGGVKPKYWQAVNTITERLTYVDEDDLLEFERENNVGLMWRISPIFDRTLCDINGNVYHKPQ